MPSPFFRMSARKRRPVQYPDNGAYMVAAYVVTAVVVVGYAAWLWYRIQKHR